MTTGAVLFAQNNSHIDYIKMAVFAAKRVQQYLEIPVSIITDNKQWLETHNPDHTFEHVIEIPGSKIHQQKKFYDGSLSHKLAEWKNFSRGQVYNLTPYDTTLVLDSDYIISSTVLKPALDRDCDLQIYHNSMDLSTWRPTDEFYRINQYSIPFYWATIFIFKKSPVMAAFFDIIAYIKDNWRYYSMLYNINSHVFRNDFAFSIAIHLMNNKMPGDFTMELPGKMTYIMDRDILLGIEDSTMRFLVEKQNHHGEYLLVKTADLDMHIINKQSLLRFIDGGSGV